jgi:hypothetical protein
VQSSMLILTRWNCSFHGEILEDPEPEPKIYPMRQLASDQEGDLSLPQSDVDNFSDSDIDVSINYRRPVSIPIQTTKQPIGGKPESKPSIFNIEYWKQKSLTIQLHRRKPFYPCSHSGSCDQARCRCFAERILCEKSCNCTASCPRRYPGCDCKHGDQEGPQICPNSEESPCRCRQLNRECDADLCGGCGAAEVLNPLNRYNEAIARDGCGNVNIQRNVHKKTYLGNSQLHGFGLYTGEVVNARSYQKVKLVAAG